MQTLQPLLNSTPQQILRGHRSTVYATKTPGGRFVDSPGSNLLGDPELSTTDAANNENRRFPMAWLAGR